MYETETDSQTDRTDLGCQVGVGEGRSDSLANEKTKIQSYPDTVFPHYPPASIPSNQAEGF